MKYIKLFESFKAKEGDIVLIHYWYNNIIVPVLILEKKGSKYVISHNNKHSKIKNAPNEIIKGTEIIDIYRD